VWQYLDYRKDFWNLFWNSNFWKYLFYCLFHDNMCQLSMILTSYELDGHGSSLQLKCFEMFFVYFVTWKCNVFRVQGPCDLEHNLWFDCISMLCFFELNMLDIWSCSCAFILPMEVFQFCTSLCFNSINECVYTHAHYHEFI
jgi:hypothetical protein